MGYSKRQFVEAAFDEIGIAGYVFDVQPEQLESALRRLDAMMAEWNAKGVRLGYPIPGSPEFSNINAESQVPDSANEAIITNLAIRIAPSYGKSVQPDTKVTAKTAYNTLLSRSMQPPEMQLATTVPVGAGNKPYRETLEPFLPAPKDRLQAGDDSFLNF